MKHVLLVGLGGAIGSILRYMVSLYFTKQVTSVFPFGTFFVNIIGCFMVGLLIGFLGKQSNIQPELKLLLIVGFCGGFTTFSTFSAETISLFQSGQIGLALLNVGLSVSIGLLAMWLGLKI